MSQMHVLGGAMTRFGRHPGVMAPELAQEAILKLMPGWSWQTFRRCTAPTYWAA